MMFWIISLWIRKHGLNTMWLQISLWWVDDFILFYFIYLFIFLLQWFTLFSSVTIVKDPYRRNLRQATSKIWISVELEFTVWWLKLYSTDNYNTTLPWKRQPSEREKKKSFPIKKWDRQPKKIMSKEKIIEYQVKYNKVFALAGKLTKEVLTKYIVFLGLGGCSW